MKKSISTKILVLIISCITSIIVILAVLNSYIISQILETTTKNHLETISELNARTLERYLNGFLDTAISIAGQLSKVDPYTRGLVSQAFVESYLHENSDAQGVWVEWLENETYGGLKADDPLAKNYGISPEYNGFVDIYYYREDGEIANGFDYSSTYTTYEYFAHAKNLNVPHIMSPYLDEPLGVVMVSAISPIHDENGNFIGCVGIDFVSDAMGKLPFSKGKFDTGISYLVADNGVITTHTGDKSLIGLNIDEVPEHDDMIIIKENIYFGVNRSEWTAVSGMKLSEIRNNVFLSTMPGIISGLVLLVLFGIIILLVIRKQLKPVGEITKNAARLAAGNLDITITHQSEDELGQLSETFRNMAKTLKLYISEIAIVLRSISDYDLTVEVHDYFEGDFRDIRHSMLVIRDGLNNLMSQINYSSEQVAIGSDHVSHGAQTLAIATSEQSQLLDSLVNSVEHVAALTASDGVNANHAGKAAEIATAALERGNAQMKDMLLAMKDINDHSKQINKIIKTIQDISFQTNILALNASIESARAGAEGKRFSVVAEEVRNLANKCAKAARLTTTLIEQSKLSVDKGTQIANDTAVTFQEITETVVTTKAKVDAILSSVGEQDVAFNQMQAGVQNIMTAVQSSSATGQESAASAEELSSQSALLKGMVGRFKIMQ